MILVTGATGLIGSHLLYPLLKSGEPVRIFLRDPGRMAGVRRVLSCYTDQPDLLLNKVELAQGDLLDYASIEDALAGVSKVYHCAAIVSFDPTDRLRVIEENTLATANLVNACLARGVEKLVHVSSTSAIGKSEEGAPITEECVWQYHRGLSGYSVSKFASEREAWRGEAEGLKVAIVNPAMVLGPGNWGESSTALILKCYQGLKFYTRGVNAYVDVRDVVAVMIMLMASEISGERFILASENISFHSFFTQVCNALGRPAPGIRARRWMGEVVWRIEKLRSLFTGKSPLVTRETARTAMANHFYSSDKVVQTLGFQFRPLSETIQWTCGQFLKDHQDG